MPRTTHTHTLFNRIKSRRIQNIEPIHTYDLVCLKDLLDYATKYGVFGFIKQKNTLQIHNLIVYYFDFNFVSHSSMGKNVQSIIVK